MKTKYHAQIRTALFGIILVGMMGFLYFGLNGPPSARAQEAWTETPTESTPPTDTSSPDSEYFTSTTITLEDGTQIDAITMHGPLQLPSGYDRPVVSLPDSVSALGVVTLNVPAYVMSFGSSATSGAMIAAYYDRNGYSNMYTGPTNGGVMPMDSSSWPDWTDGNGDTYGQCPLTASRNGLDGRTTRGSIDDYWVAYHSTAQDPYITNGWTQHAWGDAIGDYMKTSQSAFTNNDGSTKFYTYTTSSTPLTCSSMVSNGITDDGTVGRKLFYEARGYTVTDCYNQKTDNNAGGFTFALYKAEIDAGRPVMLLLLGRIVVGVGYDDATSTVYIHDTSNYETYSFTWGGSYSGMELKAVSIVNLASPMPGAFNKISPVDSATSVSTNPVLTWGAGTGTTSYEYCYDTTDDNDCSSWVPTGTTASVILSGLSPSTSYFWQVRANNADGTTYANGGSAAYWTFMTAGAVPPGAFGKSSPVDATTNGSTSPTLSWGAGSGADSYEYCYDTTDNNACSNWISTGATTSTNLSGLTRGATYYWQVRAKNDYGTTYADGSNTAYWSFTVTDAVSWTGETNGGSPVSFVVINSGTQWSNFRLKTFFNAIPCNTSGSIQVTISGPGNITNSQFSNSSTALFHFHGQFTSQYTATGTYKFTNYPVTVYTPFPPAPCTHYLNQSGTWTATAPMPPPGDFNKVSPSNAAMGQSINPTLTWGKSTNASSYEYCYDTSRNSSCDTAWQSTTAANASLAGLGYNTVYEWQVRAVNTGGNKYANAGAWWSFKVVIPPPVLTTPPDGENLLHNRPVFDWDDVPDAAGYTLQISKNNTFTQLVGTYPVTLSTYTPLVNLPANLALFWRVQSRGVNGPSPWSAVRSINTANPPGVPTLLLPAANGLTTDYTPRLDWGLVTLPAATIFGSYHIQVADNAAFTAPVVDESGLTGLLLHEYTPGTDLNSNTIYYWRVRSYNTLGHYSAWSLVRTFRTALLPPTLIAPDHATVQLTRRPAFDWSDVAGATGYTLQVSKNTAFTSLTGTYNTIASNYTPIADLPPSVTLYWRVLSKGANGPSLWSGSRSFTTPNPPGIPLLTAPANNALTTDSTPLLDWGNVTVPTTPPGAPAFDHYRVQVDDNADFSSPVIDVNVPGPVANSNYAPVTPLASNTRFYWRVSSYNVSGQYSAWSLVRYFRTAILPPVLSGPADTITVSSLRPTFDWGDVIGANGYAIQASKFNTFSPLVLNATITGGTNSHYTPLANLPVNTALYWRVKANGLNGPSLWSSPVWSFTTPNPPGVPLLISPAINALLTDYSPTLKWSKPTLPTTPGSALFDHYQLQVATDAVFTAPVVDVGKGVLTDYTTPEYTVSPDLNPNTKYYWRVRAWNTLSHYSAWSTSRYFRTSFSAPTLVYPGDISIINFLRPPFDWADVPGAAGYTIQVSRNETFTLVVVNANTPGSVSTFTPLINLPDNIPLFWRVRTNGPNGPSLWSTPAWSFTITP
jgi:hypothetical protein